jgi:hypothetical protein
VFHINEAVRVAFTFSLSLLWLFQIERTMPPKGKKKKGGEKGSQVQAKGDLKSQPKKSTQDKKASKKEADKHVNEGVRLMKKAEEETAGKKKKIIEQAKACFDQALSLMEGHADALYNLALAELELSYDICDAESSTVAAIHAHLEKPCAILSTIISNDTSNRGETTGLARRILANVYCRYYKASMTAHGSFEELVNKIKTHVATSMTILANHPDLDTLLFENCQLFHGMMSAYMEDSGDDLSALISVTENISFLRQQVNACLQTPQSSGIDMDVKLLDGAILIEVIGYFVSVLGGGGGEEGVGSRQLKGLFLVEHSDVHRFTHDCISAALQLHDALISFVPDDSEVQIVAGDLVQSAIELHDSLSALMSDDSDMNGTVFRVSESEKTGSSYDLNLQSWLLKLVNCRCIVSLQDCSANSMLALGDDLKAIGELVDSDNALPSKTKFVNDVLELVTLSEVGESGLKRLLETQHQALTQKVNGSDDIMKNDIKVDTCSEENVHISTPLYCHAKKSYESALSIYYMKGSDEVKGSYDDDNDDDEDNEEPDNIAAIHYNLLCVLWQLKDTDSSSSSSCRDHLKSYLSIEIEEACNEKANSTLSATNEILQSMMQDTDLDGIRDCTWFTEVLLEMNINELVTLDISSQERVQW